jgi:EAL domain-containing protein (putative c-di-GMP-specific phosphodiesterase class I)
VLARVLTRQHVRAVYQPIVDLRTRTVAGYEALARPANVADDGSVEEFFRTARAQGVTRDLDWLCRRAALDGARGLVGAPFLSLNLNPDALQNAEADAETLLQLLVDGGRPVAGVVVEVIRPAGITDLADLMPLLRPYRERGLRVAVAVDARDEPSLKAGLANPEFIKLSRPTVAALTDPAVRGFAAQCAARAAGGGPAPIAEGIESELMATLVAETGVRLGQGYHLGRPAAMDRDGLLRAEPPLPAAPVQALG